MKQSVLLLLFVLLSISASMAQNRIHVEVGGNTTGNGSNWLNAVSIERAINIVQSQDEIWIKKGTYPISQLLDVSSSLNSVSIYGGFSGTETNLSQRNYVANATILDGQQSTQIMEINGDHILIDGVGFKNGYIDGLASTTNTGGGAIRVKGDFITIKNCHFFDNLSVSTRGGGALFLWYGEGHQIINCLFEYNEASTPDSTGVGGAIHNWDDNVIIEDCVFKNNYSNGIGGTLINSGYDIKLTRCTFENNMAEKTGGAIYSYNSQDIQHCIFNSNNAPWGGGAIFQHGILLRIDHSTFYNNSSDRQGGALYCYTQQLIISNSQFIKNTCPRPGGALVYIGSNSGQNDKLSLWNCLFDDNQSQSHGSALVSFPDMSISNCTFVNHTNTAITYKEGSSTEQPNHEIFNSIFYGNSPYSSKYSDVDCFSSTDFSTKDFQNNIFEENPNGTNNLVGVNPQFVSASDYHLQLSSPGVEYGNNAFYTSVSSVTPSSSTDLDGNPRLYGPSIDLGVFELQQILEPPSCTSINQPTDGATDVSLTPTITWDAISGATGYNVYVGSSAGANDILNQNVGNALTYPISAGVLTYSTEYFVTVIPYNSSGDASSCTSISFETEPVPLPSCTSINQPTDGATDVNISTAIFWVAVPNATGYVLQIGTYFGGTEVLDLDVGNSTRFDFPNHLDCHTTYFVTIIPYNDFGRATSCSSQQFSTTDFTHPDCACITKNIIEQEFCPGEEHSYMDGTMIPNQPGFYSYEILEEQSTSCSILHVYNTTISTPEFPNSISPNGDGINDEFYLLSNGCAIQNFRVRLYNRWGELVYESTDMNERWQANGAMQDTYLWYSQFELNGTIIQKQGTLFLLK